MLIITVRRNPAKVKDDLTKDLVSWLPDIVAQALCLEELPDVKVYRTDAIVEVRDIGPLDRNFYPLSIDISGDYYPEREILLNECVEAIAARLLAYELYAVEEDLWQFVRLSLVPTHLEYLKRGSYVGRSEEEEVGYRAIRPYTEGKDGLAAVNPGRQAQFESVMCRLRQVG